MIAGQRTGILPQSHRAHRAESMRSLTAPSRGLSAAILLDSWSPYKTIPIRDSSPQNGIALRPLWIQIGIIEVVVQSAALGPL